VTVTAAAARPVAPEHEDVQTARLHALLDSEFLKRIGWQQENLTWRPERTDPLCGFAVCQIAGCATVIGHRRSLCHACTSKWRSSGLPLDEFVATHRRDAKERTEVLCAVVGCQRPAKSSRNRLCTTHLSHQASSGRSVADFLTDPAVTPFPYPGLCRVRWCDWRRFSGYGLCQTHTKRVQALRRRDADVDIEAWIATAPPRRDGRQVDMRGLHSRVVAELLYGIQQRYRAGYVTELTRIRPLCNLARTQSLTSLTELQPRNINDDKLLSSILKAVALALSTPESEWANDVWWLQVFGHGNRTLDFTVLTQRWLRDLAKHWVSEEMPRRRGDAVGGAMQQYLSSLSRLSDSLRLQRPDHGDDPAALGRADITAYLNRLAYLESAATISANMRATDCVAVKRVLADMRNRGKRVPGALASVLPAEFTVLAEDLPARDSGDEPGRALPESILKSLCDAIPALAEQAGQDIRVATELLIDTGRRPTEICRLPADCLHTGADGKSTLIYHDFKNNRADRRLAIPDATAEVIRQQQRRVHDRFPDTPLDQVALIPAPRCNPNGTRRLATASLSVAHRTWIDSLPPLRTSDAIVFPKATIVPYSYRHSYAQRHADAGVPPDVLRDLMAHRSMRTTQIYYRITGQRMRAAVEKVAACQFDRHGQRIWQQTQAILDDEHVRLRVGQVAVPYGVCMEPSNVKAGGHACPFRFRCLGCGHFRTDASYLPELKNYLQTLLRDRERVRAEHDLDDWARTEATPSDVEITKLRQLIHRVEDSMHDLTDDEREQIHQAATTLRRTRQIIDLGMPVVPALIDHTRASA
jgi:integrase